MGRHIGFTVIFYMVDHLVTPVAHRFKTGGTAVDRNQSFLQTVHPFFPAVVGKPFRKAVQQKPAILFGPDFAFKEHVLGCAHLRESLT